MSAKSNIEWTDATWNPTVGCSIVSPGCTNCYAMKQAHDLERRFGSKKYSGLTKVVNGNAVWTGEVRLDEAALLQPLKWKKPRRIFVNSMSDLFHESLPDEAIDRVFAVMALCPQHTFQVLTKRAERMRGYLTKEVSGPWVGRVVRVDDSGAHAELDTAFRVRATMCDLFSRAPGRALDDACAYLDKHYPGAGFLRRWPLPNVWLGVSCERQQEADERIPLLLQTPAAVRFISAEPLLDRVFLTNHLHDSDCDIIEHGIAGPCTCAEPREVHIDWVITGGESGANARPMSPQWVRNLRDQCVEARVAFFFKQWGQWAPHDPLPGGDLGGNVCSGRVRIVHPTGQSDVEVYRATGGHSTIPGSRYMERVGKKAAGRLLDGREWNEFPVTDSSVTQRGLSSPDPNQEEAAHS